MSGVHADEHHDTRFLSDPLDRSFFQTVAKGYLIGLPLIGVFVYLTLVFTTDWDTGVVLAVSVGVAFWIAILVAVVLIGMWTSKNEHALFSGAAEASRAGREAHADAVHEVPESAEATAVSAASPSLVEVTDASDAGAPVASEVAGSVE